MTVIIDFDESGKTAAYELQLPFEYKGGKWAPDWNAPGFHHYAHKNDPLVEPEMKITPLLREWVDSIIDKV